MDFFLFLSLTRIPLSLSLMGRDSFPPLTKKGVRAGLGSGKIKF